MRSMPFRKATGTKGVRSYERPAARVRNERLAEIALFKILFPETKIRPNYTDADVDDAEYWMAGGWQA